LVRERLEQPHLAALRRELGMAAPPQDGVAAPFSLGAVGKALPLLSVLAIDDTTHIVMLDGLVRPDEVRAAAEGAEGVSFVDPTADITGLLALYRERALLLVALSAVLMGPLLAWRYGMRGGLWVALPPVAAAAATPALLSLFGVPFTFFAAMALVLVLSIGFDYAVFCAEDGVRREAVTMLSVAIAALTTQLSFGLLAFSRVSAIASFGAAVLIGITLAFLLAPLAARARSRVGLSG
jgi:predicted exporter